MMISALYQFSSYIMAYTRYIQCNDDDDDICFVLDQYMVNCLFIVPAHWNNNSRGRHVAPFGHIILIPSKPIFALPP
jgi:hypothetical protein